MLRSANVPRLALYSPANLHAPHSRWPHHALRSQTNSHRWPDPRRTAIAERRRVALDAQRILRSEVVTWAQLRTRIRRFNMLTLALLAISTPLSAQATHEKFDSYIQAYVRNGDFCGAVLVAHHGHIVFRKSYGMANHEWNIPNSENTKFHIASVT